MAKKKTLTHLYPLDTYLMNDQPFICPQCGARCQEIASFYNTLSKSSIQECLNVNCDFIGFELEDEYFSKLWE